MILGRAAIDVHHHVVPPSYRSVLDAHGIDNAGGRALPRWSANEAVSVMDEIGIERAITSISSPGVWFGDDTEARNTARSANEFLAGLARDHRDRFGFFASLPLPDVDGALDELAHAEDVLGAEGVVLLSNVAGRYLGHPDQEALFAELDRRASVVLIHPTTPSAKPDLPISDFTLEFVFDTTRALVHLAYRGVLARYPRIRFIGSHAGGTLPFLGARVHRGWYGRPEAVVAAPDGVLDDLRRVRFDTAISMSPETLDAVAGFAGDGALVYGSDYPFVSADVAVDHARQLAGYLSRLPDERATAILTGNARAALARPDAAATNTEEDA